MLYTTLYYIYDPYAILRLRRVKSQVSLSLPSKKEYTLLVPLTDKQKALYKLVLGALDASAVRALFGQGGGVGDGEGEGGGVKVTDYRSAYMYIYIYCIL